MLHANLTLNVEERRVGTIILIYSNGTRPAGPPI